MSEGKITSNVPSPEWRGMIVRQADPVNLEMPFGTLDGFITSTEDFFVRCHFPIPDVSRENWRLEVTGEVERPSKFRLEELQSMPISSITATIECAGNTRVFLSPKVDGVQWERGAVGNAVWTGVRLREVIDRVGVRSSAIEALLTGADKGEIDAAPRPTGKIHYSRSLPIAKAMDDVLLAWQMNGTDLTATHGFPLRAIVPGWYGMASVKWLTEIRFIDRSFNGYFQTVDYAYWHRTHGEPALTAISEMQLKAQIARPGPLEHIPAGKPYLIRGAAWSGGSELARVEVSVDGGRNWHEARLSTRHDRYAWRLWEYEWVPPASSRRTTLMARAFDAAGRVQPETRDRDRGGYLVNEILGIEVVVQAGD